MPEQEYLSIKNKADFLIGIFLILITLPFTLLVTAVLIVLFKASPLIAQERGITMENKIFKIYKFRTMLPKYNRDKDRSEENIFSKPYLAEYVPLFCRWLRKRGLDELPQLMNVIKSEMSLIGPRPLLIEDLAKIRREDKESYLLRNKLKSKPGITGLWQIFGNRSEGITNLITLDSYYEKNKSLSLDLKIALTTLKVIIKGEHSDSIILERKETTKDNSAALCNTTLGFHRKNFLIESKTPHLRH